MPKVFSYVRFSSAKQSAGDSKARQIKSAKAFADEHGYELADPKDYLFFDAGDLHIKVGTSTTPASWLDSYRSSRTGPYQRAASWLSNHSTASPVSEYVTPYPASSTCWQRDRCLHQHG